MTLSREALERAVSALEHRAGAAEDPAQDDRLGHMRKILTEAAANDRAAAKEIQDYLDAKEGQQ